MSKKSKIIMTTVVCFVLFIIGGTAVYSNSDYLYNAVFKIVTPMKLKLGCPSSSTLMYSYNSANPSQPPGTYSSFQSFYDSIKQELESNNNALKCPYSITLYKGNDSVYFICGGTEMRIQRSSTPGIACNKRLQNGIEGIVSIDNNNLSRYQILFKGSSLFTSIATNGYDIHKTSDSVIY